MSEIMEIEAVLANGSPVEIERVAAQFGLQCGLHWDACELCKNGIDAGYDHPECMTLVPADGRRY